MSWTIAETVDERVEVELTGGHRATLRPLTPAEYRAARRRVKPLAADVWHIVESLMGDKRTAAAVTAEELAAWATWEAYLYDLAIEQLATMVLEIDGSPVTDLKDLLSRVRPVSASLALVDELATHAAAINGEGGHVKKKA